MGSPKRPPRMRSIRLTLAGLFILPLVTLVGLWAFAASVTLGDTIAKRNYDTQNSDTAVPEGLLLNQLAQERLQSFIWLGSARSFSHAPVEFQREHTDAAVLAFKRSVAGADGVMSATAKQNLAPFLAQLGQLPQIRDAIDFGTMDATQAFQAYNGIVDAEFRFFDSQAIIDDVSLYRDAEANIEMARAMEMVGREATLAGGALAARQMSAGDHDLFVQTLTDQRFLEGDALPKLNPNPAAAYRQLFSSPAYTSFKAMEDQISADWVPGAPLPVYPAAWQSGVQSFLAASSQAASVGRVDVTHGLRNIGAGIVLRLALAAGAGLLAVVVSAFLLLQFGRRITRELVGLREAARTLANERLPWVVSRLRRGEDVDVAAETPPLYPGKTTEIANVAEAFATVQRTAVEAAVGQAQLRKGVNQVFLNLARRNQLLLHRQLEMLDSMERAASDPEVLENFFRLDHLTTRMRRHAEGLIILSGEVPGRGWRSPVRVLDVLRAAISEVEDYVRVDIVNESHDAVAGTAVADVIHLLAELIENATAFSPPNTRVTVSADRVGTGFAVEIEDRGLGISPDELAEINGRLATPPEFDLADSDRLGLFAVGQLAARHQIKVSLVESPFGGTLAVVLMPHTIVVSETELASEEGNGHRGAQDRQAALETGESPAAIPAATPAGGQGPGGTNARKGWLPLPPAEPGGQRRRPGQPAAAGLARVPGPDAPDMPPELTDVAPAPVPVDTAAQTHEAWPDPLDVPDPWRETPVAPAPWAEAPGAAYGARGQAQPGSHATGAGHPPYPTDTAGTYMGLPRRIRQASLAPQLRTAPTPEPEGTAGRAAGPGQRSPEDARAIMTSLQQGWQRGRADTLPTWGAAATQPPATAAGEDSATDAEGRDV